MRIIKQNDKLLVLKKSKTFQMILGSAMSAFGIVFFIVYTYSSGFSLSGAAPSLVIFIVGISIVIFSKDETVFFDKDQNKMSILRKGLTGSKNTDYVLGDIMGIEVVERYVSRSSASTINSSVNNSINTNRAPERVEDFIVVMKNGTRIILDTSGSSSVEFSGISLPMGSIGSAPADVAASFLGVPVNHISAFGDVYKQ